MATFNFDGSTSQTIEFNATVDRVVFDIDAMDLVSVTQDEDNNTVTFVSVSGAVLTLTSTNFAALSSNTGSVIGGLDSDITFDFGTDGDDTGGTALAGNVLVGLDGDDTLNATVTGGDNDGALLLGNQGDDQLNAIGSSVRLYGGAGIDDINLTNTDEDSLSLIVGGLGADEIVVGTGYAGDITIFGGNGTNDTVDGADDITINLVDGATATIYGNAGEDDITVTGAGAATVYGGLGADEIIATVDDGLFVGGLGSDDVTVTVNEDGAVTVFGGNGLSDATDGADDISVTLGDNATATIYGNGGGDSIDVITTGSTDTSVSVFGGAGNDTIDGGALGTAAIVGDGSVVYGGLGIDVVNLELEGDSSGVTIYGGNGNSDSSDSADGITVELTTTPAAGLVPEASQTAVIYGNAGNDVITLVGAGEATVFGGAGNDSIVAGAEGRYTFTGGAGEDTFDLSGFTFAPADVTAAPGVTAVTADAEADVPFITDLTFGTDSIDIGREIDVVANVSGTAQTAGSLSAAAEAAFDSAFATTAGTLDAAVVFTYDGDSYVAFGTNVAGSVATDVEVDGYFKVTGFTGTITASDFTV